MKIRVLLVFLLLFGAQNSAQASEIPPATDVECGVSLGELICSNSIVITGSWNVTGSTSTNWYLWKLIPGQDPALISSYGSKTLYGNFPYTTGSVRFTYDYLFNFAGNDLNGAVLVGAAIVHATGGNTLSNETGRKSYIKLSEFKALVEKAKADAEAKAKADAEAKAKADAEAKAKADAEAKAKSIAELQSTFDNESKEIGAKLNSLEQTVLKYGEPKILFTRNRVIYLGKLANLQKIIINNGISNDQLLDQVTKIKTDISNQISAIEKKYTINCAKGGMRLTVKAKKPKCPSGYKVTKS